MNARAVDLEMGASSEAGAREANEDGVLCVRLPRGRVLAALADGMGGLEAGALASGTALEVLRSEVEAGSPLLEAFREANAAVRRTGDGRSGTTLVAVLVERDQVRIAHVGDSRAYHRGPFGLAQLTRDHTVGAEAEARGEWAGREVAGTPWSASLTRSLGAADHVEVDELGPFTLGESGWIVLTSDGVHGALEVEAMEEVVERAPDAAAASRLLLEAALDARSRDNVSAVVLRRPPVEEEDGPEAASWDPEELLARSHNPRSRRSWSGPGILTWSILVLVGLLVYFLLLR
jgi:protein phosphatase